MDEADPKLAPSLIGALGRVARALRELPGPGMLIGGIAVILRGVPRTTRDIDFTFSGGHGSIAATLALLARSELLPRIEDAEAFGRENQVLLLKDGPSGIEIDASLAWLSFEEEAIANAEVLVVHGVRIPVARAQDLIIYKSIAWRPQDRQDLERLISLHGDKLNVPRIVATVHELAEALGEPERAEIIERALRARVRP